MQASRNAGVECQRTSIRSWFQMWPTGALCQMAPAVQFLCSCAVASPLLCMIQQPAYSQCELPGKWRLSVSLTGSQSPLAVHAPQYHG